MQKNICAFACGVLLFFVSWIYFLQTPYLFIFVGEEKLLTVRPIQQEEIFKTRFIHSVQKTPIEEFFTISKQGNGFILKRTRYQSFGVGLPFLQSDGNFRREGNFFIMDNMNRDIQILSLRTGLKTELTLTFTNKTFRLYDMLAVGEKITLKILPLYEIFLRRL